MSLAIIPVQLMSEGYLFICGSCFVTVARTIQNSSKSAYWYFHIDSEVRSVILLKVLLDDGLTLEKSLEPGDNRILLLHSLNLLYAHLSIIGRKLCDMVQTI